MGLCTVLVRAPEHCEYEALAAVEARILCHLEPNICKRCTCYSRCVYALITNQTITHVKPLVFSVRTQPVCVADAGCRGGAWLSGLTRGFRRAHSTKEGTSGTKGVGLCDRGYRPAREAGAADGTAGGQGQDKKQGDDQSFDSVLVMAGTAAPGALSCALAVTGLLAKQVWLMGLQTDRGGEGNSRWL